MSHRTWHKASDPIGPGRGTTIRRGPYAGLIKWEGHAFDPDELVDVALPTTTFECEVLMQEPPLGTALATVSRCCGPEALCADCWEEHRMDNSRATRLPRQSALGRRPPRRYGKSA